MNFTPKHMSRSALFAPAVLEWRSGGCSRRSRRGHGVDAVRFPGESGAAAQEARLRDGVPVQDFCWERLERLAAKFGIPPPTALTKVAG
jgi:LDH2 family malate/lactate/ureidoglycolate dehydrogenase